MREAIESGARRGSAVLKTASPIPPVSNRLKLVQYLGNSISTGFAHSAGLRKVNVIRAPGAPSGAPNRSPGLRGRRPETRPKNDPDSDPKSDPKEAQNGPRDGPDGDRIRSRNATPIRTPIWVPKWTVLGLKMAHFWLRFWSLTASAAERRLERATFKN